MGSIVRGLNDTGYLKVTEMKDTQWECDPDDKDLNSSANILLTPVKILFALFSNLFNSAYWLSVQASFLLFTLYDSLIMEESRGRVSASSSDASDLKVSCTQYMEFYRVDRSKVDSEDGKLVDYNCPKCAASEIVQKDVRSQNFMMKSIPESNAYLLIATTTGRDDCECFAEKIEPTRRHVILRPEHVDNHTENLPRFRKPPFHSGRCLNETDDEAEKEQACGKASHVNPSLLMVLAFSTILICLSTSQ